MSSMESMLTQRVVVTRGEVFTKQLDVPNAELTRDAIVKSLFEVRRGLYSLSSEVYCPTVVYVKLRGCAVGCMNCYYGT